MESLVLLAITESILLIIGNDVTMFKHFCEVCKSWYAKLSPYLEDVKSFQQKQKQMKIPRWGNSKLACIYQGVTTIEYGLNVSRVKISDVSLFNLQVIRPRFENSFLTSAILDYDFDSLMLIIKEKRYKNFSKEGWQFIWRYNLDYIFRSKASALLFSDARYFQNGKLIKNGPAPSVSIYRAFCGEIGEQSSILAECPE